MFPDYKFGEMVKLVVKPTNKKQSQNKDCKQCGFLSYINLHQDEQSEGGNWATEKGNNYARTDNK